MTATAHDLYDWADDDDMGELIEGRFPQHDDELEEIDVRAFQRARVPGVMTAPAPAAVVVDKEPRNFTAHRSAARHALYVAHGARTSRAERRDKRGEHMHHRLAKTAESVGDHAAASELLKQAADHRQARHERRLALIRSAPHVAKCTGIGVGLTAAGLLALGIALAITNKSTHDVFLPLKDALAVISGVFNFVTSPWVLLPALLGTPAYVVASWWHKGSRRAELPPWLMTPKQLEALEGEPITPSSLITALRDLGLPELRKAIKGAPDAGAGLLGPITTAGCGIEVDVFLPSGVSTVEVQDRRRKLAENLGRHRHEVFVTIPERARTVRLWIAESGALDEPLPASPLVTDPSIKANYRTGRAPWGQSLRGDLSTVSLFQRHILVAGISNQGKTASLRALILWLALDPRVRLWGADFKGVGDWGMFKGIAEILIQGPTDEHVMQGTHMVEAGVVEMEERSTLMEELTEKGWSQEKILADPRFAPLVIWIDEAQKAYGTSAMTPGKGGAPYGGKSNASRYFQAIKAIHDQGRAVNVTTAEGVQDPTDANLPVRTREGNHIRASLVVGTESQSKMALGENAVNAGAAPHELRQGADKGTVVVAGDITAFDMPRGQVHTTIRTFYIGPEDAAAIADRARALRKGGVDTNGGPDGGEPVVPVDTLADVIEIMSGERVVVTEEVVHRLKDLRPAFYADWTTVDLTAALRPHGAEPYKTSSAAGKGIMHVGLARVTDALAERENGTADAETA